MSRIGSHRFFKNMLTLSMVMVGDVDDLAVDEDDYDEDDDGD